MERIVILTALVLSLVLSSCADASIEESRYILQQQSDFQTELFNLEFTAFPAVRARIKTRPSGWKGDDPVPAVLRLFVYESKTHQICHAFMNDTRPPKVVLKQCYAHQCPQETTKIPSTTKVDPNSSPKQELNATPAPASLPPPECGCNYTVAYPARGQ